MVAFTHIIVFCKGKVAGTNFGLSKKPIQQFLPFEPDHAVTPAYLLMWCMINEEEGQLHTACRHRDIQTTALPSFSLYYHPVIMSGTPFHSARNTRR